MRIVIDLQGAQTTSRYRGIGRYSLAFAEAIIRNCGKHEILLALNGLFTESIEPLRARFADILPPQNICVWYAPGPVGEANIDNDWRRKTAELVREAFLASLKPDMVVVTSLFEGLGDDAVASIGLLSKDIPTATILYDLIPLLYPDSYLKTAATKSWYENKLDHLHRADLVLTISEHTCLDAVRYLGLPDDVVVNISTASDPHFQSNTIDSEQQEKIRDRYNLHKDYVMYTGGPDQRKNIKGLICGYALLPDKLRTQHQLVVVCAISSADKVEFEALAKKLRLKSDELVFTGFVPEIDLLILYQLCKLFVFPSFYEGFGLPVLEAMSCGRAVIGSNASSIPEVIGRNDVLFDPGNNEALSDILEKVLCNDVLRSELERHGLEQAKKFTWESVAKRAINAFECWQASHQAHDVKDYNPSLRPRLAYVSPLPPERSGISDYSAELLPELSRHYDIDVIVAQNSVSDKWVNENCKIRDIGWFRLHAGEYDRVLYHFGNSVFHRHMFSLLDEIPGAVVLHDFYLSSIVAHMGVYGDSPGLLENALYTSHGYPAVYEYFHTGELEEVVYKYPCNLDILRMAQGVIVHSEYSLQLAERWYGKGESGDWAVIPLLRNPVINTDRALSRAALKISADDFLVCSFGQMDSSKLNHRLLDAWVSSDLAKDINCVLVFVGSNHEGEYGQTLLTTIRKSGMGKRVHVTGWVNSEIFHHYLAAADIGVQLRTRSRGETSAAVLDCMNHGLPTIINTNGSMADLPDDAVMKLPDDFTDSQLTEALEILWRDTHLSQQLGRRARETILEHHMPRSCAEQYFYAIEKVHKDSITGIPALIRKITMIDPAPLETESWLALAEAVEQSILPRFALPQLLIDITALSQLDNDTDAKGLAPNILFEWLKNPPAGLRVEPVYATKGHAYHYARRFTLGFMNCPVEALNDEPIEYRSGDVFLDIDFKPGDSPAHQDFYQQMRRQGVVVQFMGNMPWSEQEQSAESLLNFIIENKHA